MSLTGTGLLLVLSLAALVAPCVSVGVAGDGTDGDVMSPHTPIAEIIRLLWTRGEDRGECLKISYLSMNLDIIPEILSV